MILVANGMEVGNGTGLLKNSRHVIMEASSKLNFVTIETIGNWLLLLKPVFDFLKKWIIMKCVASAVYSLILQIRIACLDQVNIV